MSSGESATRVSERVTGPVLVAGVMKHDVEIRNSTRPFSSAFRIPGRRLEEGPALVPAKTPQVDTRASHLTGGRHASRRFPLSAAATAILLEAGPRRRILLVRRGPGFEGTLSKAPLINQPCQFRGHSSIPPRHPRRDTRATRVSFVPPSRRMLG